METRISGSNLVLDWGTSDSITSSTGFTAGKWYFIAIVWNENTDKLYLYVGDENNPPTLNAQNAAWTSAVSTLGVTQNNFMASKGGVNPTDGCGDDLRYWNTDRTLTTIQSDYKIELTGSETNLKSYFKFNNDFDDIGPNNNDASGVGSYSFSSIVPSMVTYLTNFPVLISITDSDLASDARDDGWDILFTSSNKKTKLSHEIEQFDGVSGKLVAWVKAPSLFARNNTVLYMYYGNLGSSNQQNPTDVWSSNFQAVWHLKEDPSGTAPQMKDSTSNNLGATSRGSMQSSQQVTGKIDGSLLFDETDDGLNVPSFTLGTKFTFQAWINATVVSGGNGFRCIMTHYDNRYLGLGTNGGTSGIIDFYDGTDNYFGTALSVNRWYHIVATYDGANLRIYRDGNILGILARSYSAQTQTFSIGYLRTLTIEFFAGKIDEVRVSSVACPADWIQTEYSNQNSPDTFYSLGSEESK